MTQYKKNVSLIGLRFYFAVLIFLSHISYITINSKGKFLFDTFFSNGTYGVMFFFILSGFFMYIGYGEKFENISFQKATNFIWKRISKLYPLYIITIIFGAVVQCFSTSLISLDGIINLIRFIICSLMMQSLIPIQKITNSFNGSGWFLSCLIILYCLTPYIFYYLRKKDISGIKIMIISIILYTIIIFFSTKLSNTNTFLYATPYVRIWNYLFGVGLAKFYINSKKKYYFNEIIILILCGLIYLLRPLFKYYSISSYYSICCMIIFAFLIYTFMNERGIISKFLSLSFNQFLGNISFEIYLIHYILIVTTEQYVLQKFDLQSGSELFILTLIYLLITIILSCLWKNMRKNPLLKCVESLRIIYRR